MLRLFLLTLKKEKLWLCYKTVAFRSTEREREIVPVLCLKMSLNTEKIKRSF